MTGTVPAVPQIPAGWYPQQADFSAWVTTPFRFLTTKAAFRGQRQAAQSLSGGLTATLIQLDTILEDPYGGWSASATANQPAWSWLCPPGCSGWYEVTMTAMTNSQGTTSSEIGAVLFVSGAEWGIGSLSWGVNGNTSGSSSAVQVPLTGGADYLQMEIFSTAAVSTPALAGRYPEMEIMWISA